MNKYIFLVIFLITPFAVRADSYPGARCTEDPSIYANSTDPEMADPSHIRGTCKTVQRFTVVTLDPALSGAYFLGTHNSIGTDCDITGCYYTSKFSEEIFLVSSSSISQSTSGIADTPEGVALFEKKFFVPTLTKLFRTANTPFSEETMPETVIQVYQKSELAEIKKIDGISDPVMDTLLLEPSHKPIINTLNYTAYGSAIYGLKADSEPIEAHYIDVERNGNMLTAKDLQITKTSGYKGQDYNVVPIASPLSKATNYWMFTKKDGKLVLAWQKSEYMLDTGTVKTITAADKNVSTAFLFGGTPATTTSTATSSIPVSPEAKNGFFSAIINWILSWFR